MICKLCSRDASEIVEAKKIDYFVCEVHAAFNPDRLYRALVTPAACVDCGGDCTNKQPVEGRYLCFCKNCARANYLKEIRWQQFNTQSG